MGRTSFLREEGENTAAPHAVGSDGIQHKISSLNMTDRTVLASANAARSSLKDLLLLYQSLLLAYKHQSKHDLDSSEGSPFKQVRQILTPHMGLVRLIQKIWRIVLG